MLFYGTVELRITEDDFWDMTPRKFRALTEASLEYKELLNKSSKGNGEAEYGYIDQIPGW